MYSLTCMVSINFDPNPERYGLIDQDLGLFFKCHQFESHKSQSHWKLTWSLTSVSVRLIEVHVN
jgi:hypothetical protein